VAGLSRNAVLLLSCRDRPGIVAATAGFVTDIGGNIVEAEQHTDTHDGMFFQRVEFTTEAVTAGEDDLRASFAPVAERFAMDVQLRFTDWRPRTAILVSKPPHCLADLLARAHTGELDIDVGLVIANHTDNASLAAAFGVPFHHVPVLDGDRVAQEAAVDDLLAADGTELVVLARYMLILSPWFVDRWAGRLVNIHHSFLPAFVGASPYRQAHDRGVKIIGATAHYVTTGLDEGPIIEQDVTRVSHRDDVTTLARRGRDLEVIVLARALRAHLNHRILVWGNRTIVFGA
jgi:formyltetrahydrofolate deformylase